MRRDRGAGLFAPAGAFLLTSCLDARARKRIWAQTQVRQINVFLLFGKRVVVLLHHKANYSGNVSPSVLQKLHKDNCDLHT